MREVVLDTETTGLDPETGHRIVEIACIELINRVPSGELYQTYVNPERDIPEEAFQVHGLTADFLSGHPVFADVADDVLGFLGGSALVIHNAAFDLGFLNAEFVRLGRPVLNGIEVTDTVALARQKFPGAPVSLDALCRRFGVDASARELHGALLDARLLAEVYLELMGGRQPGLGLATEDAPDAIRAASARANRAPRPHGPSAAEEAAHAAFIAGLANPIWNR